MNQMRFASVLCRHMVETVSRNTEDANADSGAVHAGILVKSLCAQGKRMNTTHFRVVANVTLFFCAISIPEIGEKVCRSSTVWHDVHEALKFSPA